MAAQRVEATDMPPKQRGDQFYATELERIRAALNQHAELLDAAGFDGIAATADHPAFATAREAVAWLLTQPGLRELVIPQAVRAGSLYLTGSGIWAPRYDFTANAAPTAGPNWRLVVDFGGQAGSIGTAGITDATDAGRRMLTAADAAAQRKLVNNPNIAAGKYGDHPRWVSTDDEQTGLYVWLIRNVLTLLDSAVITQPAAPTLGLVDDTANTFSGVLVPGYLSLADYEVFGVPGFAGVVSASAAGADIQSGRLVLRGLTGALAVGSVGLRVATSGNRPAGASLTNDKVFTGAVVVPPPVTTPTALVAAFTISNATLTAGQALSFSATASGGTAPYAHLVQATDPNTGVVTDIGSAGTPSYNGVWPAVPAGTYDLTDTVTDAAGATKVSAVRRVEVSAASQGNGPVGYQTTYTENAPSAA